MFYFVRVNGDTLHNDPSETDFYVPDEPPRFPKTKFNGLEFCLQRGIVRIGWPDTGDLRSQSKTGALAQGYSLETLAPAQQRYLRTFRDIAMKSVILMPDIERPGEFYMGEVIEPYHYFHKVPDEPYEHAHRLGVKWDKTTDGKFKIYRARELGIEAPRGFWRRAFQALDEYEKSRTIIPNLKTARREAR